MKKSNFLSNGNPENTRAIPGAMFHFLTDIEQPNEEFSLMYIEVHKGNEPPAHTHQREDESYYILKGNIRFWVGEEVIDAKAGDYVHLPKGVPHKFEVQSDCVKELMWITPSGFEKWFWDNSAPAPEMKPLPVMMGPPPPEMMAHFVQSLSEYGVEMA